MRDAFEADEIASRGKTLVLPDPPWGVKPPRPIADEPPSPDPMLEWKQAKIGQARAIADRVVEQLGPARVESVRQLALAQQGANQALRDARAQLVSLSEPQPADTDLDLLTAHEARRAALERHIPVLQGRAEAANAALGTAIQEARSDLESLGYQGVFRHVQRDLNDLDAQIEALQQRRTELHQALNDGKSMLWTWGSESYHPPIAPTGPTIPVPAQDVVIGPPKRRRGIFG